MFTLAGLFFCIGLLFGNLNAIAMEFLGHNAGIGAAVVGSVSTFHGCWAGLPDWPGL